MHPSPLSPQLTRNAVCSRHRVLYTPRVLFRGTSSDLSSKVKLDVVVVARFQVCGSQIVLASDSISPSVVKDVDLVANDRGSWGWNILVRLDAER